MVHTRPTLPAGHGELLSTPPVKAWAALARDNHELAAAWDFAVAGRPVAEVRSLARREALEAAAVFSAGLGVEVDAPGDPDGLIVATGHQPELYHPGIWVKDFLLQRLAGETGASAIDFVVDSDAFDTVSVSSPCLIPDVHRCTQYLAVGSKETCFECSSVPSESEVADWTAAVAKQLESLPAPAIRHHFAAFATALRSARADATNLAELVVYARRRFEAVADTRYLELPTTSMARDEAYAAFLVDIVGHVERFVEAYNGALADYRVINKMRSAAQPFPDLMHAEGRTELPFWLIQPHGRQTVWLENGSGTTRLVDDSGDLIAELPADPEGAIAALRTSRAVLAPKALTLTLFMRGLATDFFIHGVGGGRYDRVTDDVFRRYYGVEPPAFAVASLTMYLPLGMHVVTDDEVSAARERLNRLEHNPDAMLAEVDFDSPVERSRAIALAAEKTEFVSAIAAPDADKKVIGERIREVNAQLGTLLAPLKETLAADVAALESQQAASEILTDRGYALCFWSPLEVADKAR